MKFVATGLTPEPVQQELLTDITEGKLQEGLPSKVVCCEGNMIQEINLKFFSNQRGSISIPIQTSFFTFVFMEKSEHCTALRLQAPHLERFHKAVVQAHPIPHIDHRSLLIWQEDPDGVACLGGVCEFAIVGGPALIAKLLHDCRGDAAGAIKHRVLESKTVTDRLPSTLDVLHGCSLSSNET